MNIIKITELLQKDNKSSEDLEQLNKFFSQYEDFNKITSKISKTEKFQLLRRCSCKYFPKGSIIFSKGDPIQNLFIIIKGSVEHQIQERNSTTSLICSSGRQIGNKSSMKYLYRTSSCISLTDTLLLNISLEVFREILGEDANMLLHRKLKFIDQYFPGINKYSFSHKERIAHILEVFNFKKGTVVYKQGEIPDFIYFLCEGEVYFTSDAYKKPIIKLTPGSCFGEEIFLGGKNKFNCIVSSEQAIMYAIKKNEFLQCVPEETRDIWKRNYLLKERQKKRLNFNIETCLNSLQSQSPVLTFSMASPSANKQLNYINMRYNASSSNKDLRNSSLFKNSKKILVKLRDATHNKSHESLHPKLYT